MLYYSPLRYPGGKGKLGPFMEYMIKRLGHQGGTYIEPFAGGAAVALGLLEKDLVSTIVINDYDKGIYSFWRAILNETDRFVEKIRCTPVTMEEWARQRNVCLTNNDKYSFELGFATFYMNRTNRSGIIKGGVIGGKEQQGKWKIDARFNKDDLIKRIVSVAEKKQRIHLYNKDIESFIKKYAPKFYDNSLIYFDPPYFGKGNQLYMNYFTYSDHLRIEKLIRERVDCDWIITYDDALEIASIYKDHRVMRYDLNYSVAKKKRASEIILFSENIIIPDNTELMNSGINLNLR